MDLNSESGVQPNSIDIYPVFIDPNLLGEGISLFYPEHNQVDLELVKPTIFQSGMVQL